MISPREYGIGLMLLISWVIQAYPIATAKPNFGELAGDVQRMHKNSIEEFRESGASVPSSISGEVTSSAVAEGLNQRWQAGIAFVIAGLTSSILALFRVRYWSWAAIFTSTMYLVVWCSSGVLSSVSPITAMELKWTIAKGLHLEVSFFLKDVVLPLFYVFITTFLSYRVFRPAEDSPRKSTP